jgi:hypothetical protein
MNKLILVAGLTATLSAPALAANNLIVNGGFEANPGITAGYYNVGPSGSGADNSIPAGFGWSVPTNNVDIIAYQSYSPAPVNGGSFGLDLVGYGSTGEIAQSFSTVGGKTYNVNFVYAANPGFNGAMADVLVNGAAIGSVTGTANSWQTFTGSFIGTGGMVTFAINETFGGANGGVFLDNVSVTTVPEASTWVMMLVGFAGLGFAGYRRKAVTLAA